MPRESKRLASSSARWPCRSRTSTTIRFSSPRPASSGCGRTRVCRRCSRSTASPQEIVGGLAHVLRIDPERVTVETLADRVWEREWLRDFHPMCFGRRLWVAPHHSHVHTQGAVIVRLDPGLAFGTGTHATTAHVPELAGRARTRGTGRHRLRLWLGRARRRRREARRARRVCLRHRSAGAHGHPRQFRRQRRRRARSTWSNATPTCRQGADILLANILCGPLCELAPRFAALTAPGGKIVLAGLLATQADEVTRAHAPWFDISTFATRDGWTALAGVARSKPLVHRLPKMHADPGRHDRGSARRAGIRALRPLRERVQRA